MLRIESGSCGTLRWVMLPTPTLRWITLPTPTCKSASTIRCRGFACRAAPETRSDDGRRTADLVGTTTMQCTCTCTRTCRVVEYLPARRVHPEHATPVAVHDADSAERIEGGRIGLSIGLRCQYPGAGSCSCSSSLRRSRR